MTTLRNRFILSAALAAALAVSQVGIVYTQKIVDGKPVEVVSGNITTNTTWTNDRHWVLRGAVFVEDGATLTIQAGTRVVGESWSIGTLIVARGGKLNAIGTREQPIVFTSDQAPGSRARGDWGGIILNGRAPVNLPGGLGEGEGDTGIYGGSDPNDSSGNLKYVRVEFAGTEFSPDNELNGIAFQAVGRGGSFDYLQVHMNKDDAVEFFGGTADAKHLVLTNAGDDNTDWTFGWTGRLQYVVVSQRGDDSDTGIEADNSEFNHNALPRSAPQLYNLTYCGDPNRDFGAESTHGFRLRRGTAGVLRNFIVMGFKNDGMRVDDSATQTELRDGGLVVDTGIVFNNGPSGTTPYHSGTVSIANLFRNISQSNPGIGNCFNHSNPNWQPTSVATLAGGQMAPALPPNDGWFDVTTFIGAVPPAPADDWTTGWTAYPQS